MGMKMLTILLASWLVLARSATLAPTGDGAGQPPPAHSDDFSQKEIDPFVEIPFQFLLQKEINPDATPPVQQEVFDLPLLIHGEPQRSDSALTPRGRRPPSHVPFSSNVAEFPPGRPSLSNIRNICTEGRHKAAYGPWNLPHTGFSHLTRQGNALNTLEESLGRCCQLPEEGKLHCSQAAWSHSLEQFCTAEFSVKTRPYHCCKLEGGSRERCFAHEAPFPNYDYAGDEAQPSSCTHSDPSQCQPEDLVSIHKLPAISFPPGKPNNGNIKNICKLHKFRPIYHTNTLPKSGFGWYVRQARTINRLEIEFKKCCRKQDVSCAHRGWEKVLAQFCKQEFAVKTKPHLCCKEEEGEDRLDCFANQAPFPAYDQEMQVVNLAEVTPSLLDLLCNQVMLLSKQKHIPALIQNITEPCCNLQGDERTQCAEQEKSQFITTLCNSPKALWKDTKKCCSQSTEAARSTCFDSSYLSNVTLASAGQPLQPTLPAP